VLHHARIQKRSNETSQSRVGDPLGHSSHQRIVVDPVEKFLQVKVHDPPIAVGDVALRLGDRLMGRAIRPEPVALRGERRVPCALQDLQHRLLDEAVERRRDAQLADTPIRLRNLDPPHRLRPIGPAQQLGANRWPLRLQVDRQLFDGHPVDAGASFVASDSSEGLLQILPVAHLLHQHGGCRAFGSARRRGRFDPLRHVPASFTRLRRVEGQRELDWLSRGAHEIRVLLPLFTVWAFGHRDLLCPLLTSAPRSPNLPIRSVPRSRHGADLPR